MAEVFVKPPEPLKICSGNPAHSWEKWKIRFEIYLQATGTSSKADAPKVGLSLNHIGDRGIEIHRNFHFTPPTPSAEEGGDLTPGEDQNNYDTLVGKFDAYFTKHDLQLMLREKFWLRTIEEGTWEKF